MEIVRKKIKRIDLGNCSYDDIKVFYSDQCNKRTICLFYKKEKLITILSVLAILAVSIFSTFIGVDFKAVAETPANLLL